ncbi:transmembrane protein 254 [Chanos chanos]|uniref:Transmembrane protein 254 n=1 Tax=Chanos chanos TaxID=29144 RepID=A0A6J2V9C0_CHACN|nr:transmembrane protein 254 [Chanos chanos]
MAKSDGYAYFRRTSLFWIITVTLSMGYFTWTVFWPSEVPYGSLGPLGSLSKYLVDNHYHYMYYGWWMSWAVHMMEAILALKMCGDKGIESALARTLWFGQTFLFGFASLGLLLKYKPDKRAKQQ